MIQTVTGGMAQAKVLEVKEATKENPRKELRSLIHGMLAPQDKLHQTNQYIRSKNHACSSSSHIRLPPSQTALRDIDEIEKAHLRLQLLHTLAHKSYFSLGLIKQVEE